MSLAHVRQKERERETELEGDGVCAFEQRPCPLFCCLRVPDELGVEVGASIAGLHQGMLSSLLPPVL